MNKIVIKLYVPSIEQEYDVKVPTFLSVGEIVPLFAKSLLELSDGKYYVSGSEILCLKNRNIALDYRHTISECGIQNGDILILI